MMNTLTLSQFDLYHIRDLAEKVLNGERLSFYDGLRLMELNQLTPLGALADVVRRKMNGNKAYFIRNQHFDPSNICAYHCLFCSWRRDKNEDGAWQLSESDIVQKINKFRYLPISEIHMVSSCHPELSLDYYENIVRTIKKERPEVHIQAFTAVEIFYLHKTFNIPLRTVLERLQDAGVEALPGGGAEIFSDRVRRKICRDKASADEWLKVHQTAHQLGMPTNATIMFGHIETPEERIDHLLRLRSLQDETGGFECFSPMPFHPENNALRKLAGVSPVENLKMMAISRLMLDNIPHIKAFWIMLSPQIAQTALHFGADDLDGTVLEESILHDAGAQTGQTMTMENMIQLIQEAGFLPVERDTLYNELQDFPNPRKQTNGATVQWHQLISS